MSSRHGAVHVATTSRQYKGKTYSSHLLRRSYRVGEKVRHETLGNISHLPEHIVDIIRRALQGESFVAVGQDFEIVRTRPHGHVAAVLGSLRKLELERLIASQPSRWRDLVVAMIVARVIDPDSKLATARGLNDTTQLTTLREELGIEAVNEDDLYAAMDWLVERQPRIEKKLAKRHLEDGALVLYDVTSTYYTGTHCGLASFGHNRDGKKRFPQIVIGLLCNGEGCPIAVEVFKGNTADPKTVGPQIEKLRKRFGIKHIVLVGDRGMITQARINAELEPAENVDWITALRAPAIKKLTEQGAIQLSLFDKQDLAELTSPDFPDERLIACLNPSLKIERAKNRNELLAATRKALDKVVAATLRSRRPLRGQDKIALRVGKFIDRHKMSKHFTLTIKDDSFSYELNTAGIAEEATLDGIYVIRTSLPKATMGNEQAVKAYKSLAVVERAFRSLKTVDLKIRPVRHRLAERVKAHVFICMLAYYVEWHMRRPLAPLLFDDDDKATAEALRDSVVASAVRSPRAQNKALTKHTEAGEAVQSFQSLLKNLATVARNRVQLPASGGSAPVEFDVITTPTPLQRQALELLEVRLAL